MTPIYSGQTKPAPPKQDEGKTRELADAIKRREDTLKNLDPFVSHTNKNKMKIEKEKG